MKTLHFGAVDVTSDDVATYFDATRGGGDVIMISHDNIDELIGYLLSVQARYQAWEVQRIIEESEE